MKDQSKNKHFLNILSGFSILSVLLFTFTVYVLKDSYAIPVSDSNIPTNDFTTNYNGSSDSLKNYIEDALGSSYENRKYFENFRVPDNYKTSDSNIPLYILTKNSKFARNTESFELKSGNPTSITDNGLKYIITHGYNQLNTNNVFDDALYGPVADNNIKHYVTQIAIWLYLLEHENEFTSSYCSQVNIHMSEEDETPESFAKISGCSFYHYVQSSDYNMNTANIYDIKKIVQDAGEKSGYNYLNYIINLLDEADAHRGTSSNDNAGIELSPSGSLGYSIPADGKSLTTEAIKVTNTNPDNPYLSFSVEIEDPNKYGVYLIDQNGKKIENTDNMNSSFRIFVPLKDDIDLTTVKVKVNASFLSSNLNGYNVTKTTAQDKVFDSKDKQFKFSEVLLGYIPTKTSTLSISLSNVTKFSKVDATNGKELPGAKLEVRRKGEDEILYNWVSETNPKFFYLEDGNYTLCESSAPKGYELQEECVDFFVDGSKINTVVMKNTPTKSRLIASVPNTGTFINILLYICGGAIILTGVYFIGFTLYKNKK